MATLAPADQQRTIAESPDVFYPAAGAWGAMGCTLIRLDEASEEAVGEALTLAWQLAREKGPTRSRPKKKATTRKTVRRGR